MRNYSGHGWEGKNYDRSLDIKDIAKKVRKALKEKYPETKWSVTIERYSGGQSLNIYLLEAPFNVVKVVRNRVFENGEEVWKELEDDGHYQVNQYHLDSYEDNGLNQGTLFTDKGLEVLRFAIGVATSFNYDDSESMIDYFDTNFYMHVSIGKWDKPFKNTAVNDEVEEEEVVAIDAYDYCI